MHQRLYGRNLTLINITNFQFLINNDICNDSNIALVTLVYSATSNFKERTLVRQVHFYTYKGTAINKSKNKKMILSSARFDFLTIRSGERECRVSRALWCGTPGNSGDENIGRYSMSACLLPSHLVFL